VILRGRAVWHPWRNGPRGVIASAPARPPVRGWPPSAARSARRRRASDGRAPSDCGARSRSKRLPVVRGTPFLLRSRVAREAVGPSGSATRNGRYTTARKELRKRCQDSVPTPIVTAGRTNSPAIAGRSLLAHSRAERRWLRAESRSARDAPIDGLIRVSARRSCVGTPPIRYDVRNVKPSSARATSWRTARRGLLRRLARRTRPNDDAGTRVIDRKCAAF
jgi:hypothetical protein